MKQFKSIFIWALIYLGPASLGALMIYLGGCEDPRMTMFNACRFCLDPWTVMGTILFYAGITFNITFIALVWIKAFRER